MNITPVIGSVDEITENLASMKLGPEVSSKNIQMLTQTMKDLWEKKINNFQALNDESQRCASEQKSHEDFKIRLNGVIQQFLQTCYHTADQIVGMRDSEERRHMAIDMQRLVNKLVIFGMPDEYVCIFVNNRSLRDAVFMAQQATSSETMQPFKTRDCTLQSVISKTLSIRDIDNIVRDQWYNLEKRGKLNTDLINTTIFDTLLNDVSQNPEAVSEIQGLQSLYIKSCFSYTYHLSEQPEKSIMGSKEIYEARLRCFTKMCKDIVSNKAWDILVDKWFYDAGFGDRKFIQTLKNNRI